MTDVPPDQLSSTIFEVPEEGLAWLNTLAHKRAARPGPLEAYEKPPSKESLIADEVRRVMRSTPYLAQDFNSLRHLFRAEAAHIKRHEGEPFDDASTYPLHRDTLERYRTLTRTGRQFDPDSVESFYPNATARRRRKIKTARITIEQARDVYQVLGRLLVNGDPVRSDQLPPRAISSLHPHSVVNKVVDAWMNDLGFQKDFTGRWVDSSAVLAEPMLIKIANRLLSEAHPDRQELTTQRRRKDDVPISTPLFIHTIPRIRDDETQIENVQILEVTNRQFHIAKSAVGAYIELVGQHGLSPSVEGFAEMFRRGLFPFSVFSNDHEVLNAMHVLTGRTWDEIKEAIQIVDESHRDKRAENLVTLINGYEKFLDDLAIHQREEAARIKREQKEKAAQERAAREAAKIAAAEKAASEAAERASAKSAPVSPEPKVKKQRNRPNPSLVAAIDNAEKELERLLMANLSLMHHLSVFAGDMTRAKNVRTGKKSKSYLPSVIGEVDPDHPDAPPHVAVVLSPTNLWFETMYDQFSPYTDRRKNDPFGLKSPISAEPDKTRIIVEGFCGMIDARSVDVFNDAIAAHMLANVALRSPVRDYEFVSLAKDLDKLLAIDDAAYVNTIQSIRDPSLLEKGIADTSKIWQRIFSYKFIQREPEPDDVTFDMTNSQIVRAAMVFQLDLQLAARGFGGQIEGFRWGLSADEYDGIETYLTTNDPSGSVLKYARNTRAAYGTGGKLIAADRDPTEINLSRYAEIVKTLRPVAQIFDDAFVGMTGELKQEVHDRAAANPTIPQR